MEEILEKAVQIAVNAHMGQKDKAGYPYIFHPLRVMHKMNTTDAKIVAVLHDVVEDTGLSADDLIEQGIPKHLVITLRLLSKQKNMSYEDYIARIAENPLATRVKLADIKDNMDVSRLKELTPEDTERLKQYIENYKYLKSRIY